MTLRIKLYSLAYGLDFLSNREARITSRTIYGGKSPKSCGSMILSALSGYISMRGRDGLGRGESIFPYLFRLPMQARMAEDRLKDAERRGHHEDADDG